ncbi:MAG: LptF/LptG family permease [Rhizobiaceae bacterium]
MGLTLIERYVMKKAAIAVFIATSAMIAVLWVARAVQEVDVLLDKGQGIFAYLSMTTLGVPTLAAAIIPVALMLGLIHVINGLNKDSELVVMHASGASRAVLFKPFIVLSIIVSLIVWNLHLFVAPLSMQTLRGFISNMRADLVSVVVQEGKFQSIGNGLMFHVASRSPGGLLNGIFIHDNRNPDQIYTYLSKKGAVSEIDGRAYLLLNEGQIHRQDGKDADISIINFNSYAFNLSELNSSGGGRARSQMELGTYELLFPDKDDPYYKNRPGNFRSELHTRLTGGLYPIIVALVLLTFIGNPNSHRQGQTIVIIAACLAIVGPRGLTVWAEGLLKAHAGMVYVVWAIPLLQIAYSAGLLLTDHSAIPPSALTWFDNRMHRISQLLEPIRQRLLGDRVVAEGAS